MTVPNTTLQDKVRFEWAFACNKHYPEYSPEGYADEQINRLTNAEFLERLSEALEELLTRSKP